MIGFLAAHAAVGHQVLMALALAFVGSSRAHAQRPTAQWQADTVAVIGAFDGAAHETFGRLWRAALRSPDHLYLFDLLGGFVFWYGLDGRFRGSIVASGAGPGELGQPIDFHVEPDGSVWVLDPGNARISRFSKEGGRLQYVESIRHALGLGTFCTLGDKLFHATSHAGSILHEIQRSGGVRRSVGHTPEVAELTNLPARYQARAHLEIFEGAIYCDEDRNQIVVAFGSHPTVQSFDIEGSERWSVQLPSIQSLRFIVTDAGRFRADFPESGVHFLKSVVRWTDDLLLLQYELRRPGEPPEDREFHLIDSRFIDLRNGRQLERRADLPLIGARLGQHVVVLENLPFPRALVLRLR